MMVREMRGSVFSSCPGTSPKLGSTALILRRNRTFAQFKHGSKGFEPKIFPISLGFRYFFTNQLKKDEKQECRCGSAFSSFSNGVEASDDDFIVVNFYHFVYMQDPEEEVANHLSFLQGLDIHGRVYINEKGINAQYSGPSKDALAYLKWLKEDRRYSDILVQISPALSGHAFPRLKLRYKPSLVQLEGGISHLPLLDPSMRATPLRPSEWRRRLETANNVDGTSSSKLSRKFILLDVRNGYEWDIGHFRGAQRPDVDSFRSTSFGRSKSVLTAVDPLTSVDKESTDILMYCTGGIRCDVYSTILRQKGFQNLYTLKGGVSHYLKTEGPIEWVANLFVFDSRLSLPPSAYKPGAAAKAGSCQLLSLDSSFLRCYICALQLCEPRHRNCANLDCNLLFLCCGNCMRELQGCCSLDCTSAPRLRPILPGHQRYEKWHIYRDFQFQVHSKKQRQELSDGLIRADHLGDAHVEFWTDA